MPTELSRNLKLTQTKVSEMLQLVPYASCDVIQLKYRHSLHKPRLVHRKNE